MKSIILIPSYKPDSKLVELIISLKVCDFHKIVIVNNGNNYKYNYIFEKIVGINNVFIVKVDKNLGKGFGLKKGLNFIKNNFFHYDYVIFADADGQHTPKDILKFKKRIETRSENKTVFIGRRMHNLKTPKKNYFGNLIYNFLLRKIKKINIHDSLCGLRAFSINDIHLIENIKYNDFRYEVEIILKLNKDKFFFEEIYISSKYFKVSKSNFSSFFDSIKLLSLLFSRRNNFIIDIKKYFKKIHIQNRSNRK